MSIDLIFMKCAMNIAVVRRLGKFLLVLASTVSLDSAFREAHDSVSHANARGVTDCCIFVLFIPLQLTPKTVGESLEGS